MKFWFFSSKGIVIAILLMFTAVFCNQDLSTETNATAINDTMEIPCSLDDTEGNGTDCRNASQISYSPKSQRTSGPNSNEDPTTTLCSPNGCSDSYASEVNTTSSLEVSPVSVPNNFSEIDNSMVNNVTKEHFTAMTIFSNETVTSTCSPEGCSMSNVPERNSSESSSGSELITSPKINNFTESTETTVATAVSSNETFENPSSVAAVREINETSDSSDVDELIPVEELYDNSSSPFYGNASVTSQSINTSAPPTELSNTFSNSSEDTFSEESLHYNNSQTNTTHHTEGNDTVTTSFYTEPNLFNTSDHISEVNNVTEILDPFINLHNITGEENNASTTRPRNESLDDITEFIVENITLGDFPTSSSEAEPELTTNATSTPDDSTPFYTMSFSLNDSDSTMTTPTEKNVTDFSTDTSSNSLLDSTTTESSELPLLPSDKIYIVVELRINCSVGRQEKEIALLVAQMLNATLKENYDKECNNLHNVTLSILKDSLDFATVYRLLSEKVENAKIIRVMYDGNSANATFKNATISDSDVTENEMILYITLGTCLGAVFFIALAIICFKCCRRRPSKPIDVDVPHLNVRRLEDYALTRIPRPNTVYLDYFRGPIVSERYSAAPLGNSMSTASESDRGMVQPFDTSVVPLEDAKKLDQLATSPSRTSCPSTPLRTFGRKDWKRGDNLIYENVISSSTEKLHPDFYTKYGYPGMENPTFAA